MRLLDWMQRECVDDDEMARRVNKGLPRSERCTGYAVKKWKYGERKPPGDKVLRIEEITRGEVALPDFFLPIPAQARAS